MNGGNKLAEQAGNNPFLTIDAKARFQRELHRSEPPIIGPLGAVIFSLEVAKGDF